MDETHPSGEATQTPLTRAMETIRTLRAQLGEQQGNQPVAVIGAGLRLPDGIDDLDAYWTALAEGRDAVRPMPQHRKGPFADAWEGVPQRGGFLDEVLDFDAEFFGISPAEARHLDPQHRLLLEVAWEAMEHAGLPAPAVGAARTGLYLGVMWQDYREWCEGEPDAYWATGNGHNFAAGRVAYALGLTGPAMTVDTACSSSLAAVHLAVQALRRGDCDIAFAAGANLIMSPRTMRLVQETRGLAPDGLCKTFDARANGFTRGEGVGAVLLKRLDHALRDGDRVLGVVRGTAVNQDGRSSGFTAPNVLAQVSLIESALADAGLDPASVGYAETHGTGTALGDPIEMEALATVLGRRNGGAPLPVGAVKTNFGHLEGTAGLAGLIKALLCIRHRKVPPVVHFRTLNPRIDLSGTGMSVPDTLQDWSPQAGGCASVSSFGMSGTNAHAIVGPLLPGELPGHEEHPHTAAGGFELSAKTDQALRARAGAYADVLDALPPADYPAFAYTSSLGRTRLDVRARVTATNPAEASAALRLLADGAASDRVTVTEDPEAPETGSGPADELPRKLLDLPAYPWQRRRHAPKTTVNSPSSPARPDLPTVHEVRWEPVSSRDPEPVAGSLVLAGDDDTLLSRLVERASALGLRGTVLTPNTVPVPDGWSHSELPQDTVGWHRFRNADRAAATAPVLLAMRATELPRSPEDTGGATTSGARLCATVTTAVTALAEARAEAGAESGRAFAVTRAARRVVADETATATGHGLLHGLAPVLGLELGAGWGGVVDLPDLPTAADLDVLLRFVVGPATTEDLAAVRDGALRVARLRESARQTTEAFDVRHDATYVVTGGLGGVGRQLTAELVTRGARHLLLVGRRQQDQLDPDALALLRELDGSGVRVVYSGGGCDTPDAVAMACAPLTDLPPVRGVLHAAGTLERTPAAKTGVAEYEASLRGKFTGAWLMHLASRDWPLDFFVLVSSVSAVWGTERCAAYAAANGGLDALAAHRASRDLPALSLAYGPWDLGELGMADAASRETFARVGVGTLDPRTGRAALATTGPGGSDHVVICPLDMLRLRTVMSGTRPRGLFAAEPERREDRSTSHQSGAATLPEPSVRDELAVLPERTRAEAARTHVARIVATQLGYDDEEEVRHDAGFFDLGLDSITAVDLVNRLSQAFEATLQTADVFDHPTVSRLTEHILATATDSRTPAPGAAENTPSASVTSGSSTPVSRAPARRTSPVAAPVPEGSTEDPHREPVAVVGMAGRFPQSDSVEELWDLLREGRDGVGPVPEGRYGTAGFHGDDEGRGQITTDQGGFLNDIARFDASFFGVPAREAENLDPQQRLLLESAWHALESGGIDPHTLRGTRAGVFVGVSYADYARLLARPSADQIDAYYTTGTSLNASAGRLSYTLGLNGPAMAVDTACSSSLVALHLGVRSLRSGESDAVLAGGVNLILDPMASVAASRAHMLSPDGRCRTFSADANGFVRAEGCGVLVLKRLDDAQRDGDRVLAVIRGSAVNQDGASSGLTAPSGSAQRTLLADALADASVTGGEVSYLEAHGTGTTLGDPIELGAAWGVLGPGRKPGEPLHVGSVKSNVGHCESAAGIVAVIKTILALRHDLLPANLHYAEPNPHVDWPDMNVRVVDTPVSWRPGPRPRVAGVSGFGLTGTNAHIVLADPPSTAPPVTDDGPDGATHIVPLSAPDADGLERLSRAWEQHLTSASTEELPGVAATAATGRAHFPHRRALLGTTTEKLLAQLAPPPETPSGRPRVAFLFSGQGSQRFGMARDLYETEPVFREVFDTCDRELTDLLGGSLVELTLYGADQDAVHETRLTQPALFAMEIALATLWESWGVTPTLMMGHSVGEVAAAVHAGVLDLPSGLRLIAQRARLMQRTERGAMLAVQAPEDRVRSLLRGTELDLAAVNAPEATTVSGTPEGIDRFAALLTEEGVRAVRIKTSHAFHSRLLDPVLDELRIAAEPLEHRPPQVPLISNLTGRPAGTNTYHADYWVRHARDPVRFHDGARQLSAYDIDVCLEIGPDRTLINLVRTAGLVPAGGAVPSLRRSDNDRTALLTAVKALYERGQDIDWHALHAPHRAPRCDVPRYPFADTAYWPEVSGERPAAQATPVVAGPPWGTELTSPALRGRVFVTERSTSYPPHLDDHRLFGTVQVAGASQTATVLSALSGGGEPILLEDLHFPRALVLHEGERYELQVIEDASENGARAVSVHSLLDPERGLWQAHLTARRPAVEFAEPAGSAGVESSVDPAEFIANADRHLSGEAFYRHLRGLGYLLGSSFRWVGEAWIRGEESLIRFTPPTHMNEDPADYQIHPGLLDSCFQSSVAFAVHEDDPEPTDQEQALVIPFAVARVSFRGRPTDGEDLWGHVKAVMGDVPGGGFRQLDTANLHLFDDSGATVLTLDGFRFRPASRTLLLSSLRQDIRHTYQLVWDQPQKRGQESPTTDESASSTPHHIAVVGSDTEAGRAVIATCAVLGHRTTVIDAGSGEEEGAAARAGVDLIVDARCPLPAADKGPETALDAATGLTTSLRTAPRHVPYAVLADGSSAAAPVREALWGLLASLEAEQEERRLLRVTLADGWEGTGLVRALVRAVEEGVPETRLELSSQGTRVARLAPYAGRPAPRSESDEDGEPRTGGDSDAALITGGLGALGLSSAVFLARHGVRVITLMARSAPDPTAQRVIEELVSGGTELRIVHGDVTDPVDCARAVAEASRTAPLRTVLHLAGTTDDRAFDTVDRDAFASVFAAKAHGAVTLATALDGQALDAFVLFSSASSVLGSAGQTNYAAANGFLSGLATALSAQGFPATSVAWGPWTPGAKSGLAASEAVQRAVGRLGIGALTDEAAEKPLLAALTDAPACLVAVDVDPEQYTTRLAGHPRAALLTDLASGASRKAAPQETAAQPRGWLRGTLDGLDATAREECLRQYVRETAGEALGSREAVDDETGFGEMGLDSIMVIDLRTRLSHALDVELFATVALDHPTVPRISAHILGLLQRDQPDRERAGWESRPGAPPEVVPPDVVPSAATEGGSSPDPAALSFDELIRAVHDDVARRKETERHD